MHPLTAGKLTLWRRLKHESELAALVGVHMTKVVLMKNNPLYTDYRIKKNSGGFREIEDPCPVLKKIQRGLNGYLQLEYSSCRPLASHGFCVALPKEEIPRGIKSNALCHLGNPYMVNFDFKDFFHQIRSEQIHKILKEQFPEQHSDLRTTLIRLTTRNDRLPMGAPTSPVLSNFACIHLDEELDSICRASSITYTRFADDLTFSSKKVIESVELKMIRDCINNHGFQINEQKYKYSGPGNEKIVTGIVLENDRLGLPKTFLSQLRNEIERYNHVLMVESRYKTGMSHKKLKLFEQELQGKLSFATEILFPDDPVLLELRREFEHLLNSPEDFELTNWLDIPYNF